MYRYLTIILLFIVKILFIFTMKFNSIATVIQSTNEKPITIDNHKRNFIAKGIYISGNTAGSKRIFELVDKLLQCGGNTIVFDAKDVDGMVTYNSNSYLVKKVQGDRTPPIKNIKKLIDELHKKGIYIVTRIALFCDQALVEYKPVWAVYSKKTGKLWKENNLWFWLDPSLVDVQNYNLSLACELAKLGVDEIQFDYIRFPAKGDIKDAVFNFDTNKIEKHTIITSFLKKAREKLSCYNVLLSIDVFGVTIWQDPQDLSVIGQNLVDLFKYIDIISPMLYPSHFEKFNNTKNPADYPYEIIYKSCDLLKKLTKNTNVIIRPWLQCFPLKVTNFNKFYILEQLKAIKDVNEISGWLMWSAKNNYDKLFEALR